METLTGLQYEPARETMTREFNRVIENAQKRLCN